MKLWICVRLTGYQDDCCRCSVSLGEAPQALPELVIGSILGGGVDMCNSNLVIERQKLHIERDFVIFYFFLQLQLLFDVNLYSLATLGHNTWQTLRSFLFSLPPKETKAQHGGYLAVVELLNDSFAFLVDVTHTNELCFPVALEEAAANALNNCPSGASTGHAAVLNVPEDAHWREVFRNTGLWGTWQRFALSKKQS